MSRALIVFAKEPAPGTVKTRLRRCFSDRALVRLYKAFVKDTLAIAKGARNTKKYLAFSSAGAPRFLRSVSDGFELIEQKGRALGDRMHNAFTYARENKSEKTVIIGTDSPTLPARVIAKAFRALNRKDIILGPSVDGGYYLIGMKEPHPEIFKGVRWSSASVLKRTLANARTLGASTSLLEQWYDVDDRKGLSRLRNDLKTDKGKSFAKHTRMVLKNISIL